jgi:hypothetical protein
MYGSRTMSTLATLRAHSPGSRSSTHSGRCRRGLGVYPSRCVQRHRQEWRGMQQSRGSRLRTRWHPPTHLRKMPQSTGRTLHQTHTLRACISKEQLLLQSSKPRTCRCCYSDSQQAPYLHTVWCVWCKVYGVWCMVSMVSMVSMASMVCILS